MTSPVYLDYAATTPVDPRVAELMARHLTLDGVYANPASRSHMPGWLAEQAVESARRQVADLIAADPREIVWTSGATEADNLALTGFMRANRARGRHLVTSRIEHKAVVDTATALEAEGFDVTWLTPGADGRVTPTQLNDAMREDTVLVSLMAVNNELGSIHDLAALAEVIHAGGAVLHVDAAQATGKIALDVNAMGIDLMSMSAHKTYGPKGVGALYVRRSPDIRLEALIHGGGHERGMRSGTLPTHQIAGMGAAFALAGDEREADHAHGLAMRQRFLDGLEACAGVHCNTALDVSVPTIVNLAFDDVDGESLLMALRALAVSTGSACNSASVEPSYVLKAIGIDRIRALASIRFSFGRFTTEADIDTASAELRHALGALRQ
ncbi:cysteine desulfurase IscS [Chromohalobacter marismortui]|uniref:cysteine desulfurase n=1 Tax=Chromohalobacter marismortui TaxID=42055 RepID=A0A4R7NFJ0_9GAMM|nr:MULTISPECIES: aminotransferase class V-fold PLP-dependent enzyme [Chromohalobacter]MCI0509391.1 aminotransferase class V-fold PLP-dependent enzyme [Chromohalobacter sp.]MCI0593012.1 aminotransferase class V-fold PLP-dependent enzyme [Chromohalobacter sp.]TDU19263.1 cysteine desulfurase IscS [Chromohalobacter marismortui]